MHKIIPIGPHTPSVIDGNNPVKSAFVPTLAVNDGWARAKNKNYDHVPTIFISASGKLVARS